MVRTENHTIELDAQQMDRKAGEIVPRNDLHIETFGIDLKGNRSLGPLATPA
jgi:hypothetical protein